MEEAPYGFASRKLAMWIFIIADASAFGAMLFAYGYVRVASPDWSRPFEFSPTILSGLIMTALLLGGSLAILRAFRDAKEGNRGGAARWLGITALLGLLFTGLHIREWAGMLAAGWRPAVNPLGGSVLFGASYFGITGLELLHVVVGVCAVFVVALKYRAGRLTPGHVETTGLYWHFVNLVWMFVFPLVYLLNTR